MRRTAQLAADGRRAQESSPRSPRPRQPPAALAMKEARQAPWDGAKRGAAAGRAAAAAQKVRGPAAPFKRTRRKAARPVPARPWRRGGRRVRLKARSCAAPEALPAGGAGRGVAPPASSGATRRASKQRPRRYAKDTLERLRYPKMPARRRAARPRGKIFSSAQWPARAGPRTGLPLLHWNKRFPNSSPTESQTRESSGLGLAALAAAFAAVALPERGGRVRGV